MSTGSASRAPSPPADVRFDRDDRPVLPHRPILHVLREIRAIATALTPARGILRDRIVAIVLVTIIVDLVCAVLAYAIERHGTGTEIHTFGTALFWTSTQLLTVSSQLKNPVTGAGQVLDVAMEAYAITVVASLAGSFGSFFHHRSAERAALPGIIEA
jgi:hypothetical protein